MLNRLKKKDQGFTIIEVLIVLAIAGLILLIVFLAVPALQRSSRNTQRKNDASAVAGAVGNFISNNGGAVPLGVKVDGTDANTVDVTANNDGSGNSEIAKLGYYDPANVSIVTSDPGAVDTTHMYVVTGYTCNPTNTGLGNTQSRSTAILYAVETSGTKSSEQCLEQ